MELDEGNLNGKIYLFGTGKISKNYTEILQQLSIKIYGYIDNDINKWGSYFFDKEIYPPNILKTEENTMVIIACSDIKTITNQIRGLGIKSKVVSIDYIIRKAIERLEIKSQQLEKPSIKCYQKKTIIVDNLNGSWGGVQKTGHMN